MGLGIHWTNHPLIDAGIASLLAFADCQDPQDLTAGNLEDFARYAEAAYFSAELSSVLPVLFNVTFLNPSFSEDKKRMFVAEILRQFKAPLKRNLPPCAYCNGPAVRTAHRDLIPMVMSRQAVNFFPGGTSGLAICGNCLTAIQALTIGAPVVSGKVLVPASDNPLIVLEFVREWQPQIRKRIEFSQHSGERLTPLLRPLSRTIETVLKWVGAFPKCAALTLYHLSNLGQNPSITIYFLRQSVIRFIHKAQDPKFAIPWNLIVSRAATKSKDHKNGKLQQQQWRNGNFLYEDLFSLPELAGKFVSDHFLKTAKDIVTKDTDITGIWELTAVFLGEILSMENERISTLQNLGDALGTEIASQKNTKLWNRIYGAKTHIEVRQTLIGMKAHGRQQTPQDISVAIEAFLQIFEGTKGFSKLSSRLVWDLVKIKICERLFILKWFDLNRDTLAHISPDAKGGEWLS